MTPSDWGFDYTPDLKVPHGMAGDIPLVGNFMWDGLTSFVIYRNGIWYIDNNRDGKVDQTVVLGGMAGDVQWLYVVAGRGTAIVNGRRYRIGERSLLLIERGDRHEIRANGGEPLRTLNFYVPPAYTKDGDTLPPGRRGCSR